MTIHRGHLLGPCWCGVTHRMVDAITLNRRLSWPTCPGCGERYINVGAHAEACRGKPEAVTSEAVSPRKGPEA